MATGEAPAAPSPGQAQGQARAAGLTAVSLWGLAPVATRALVSQLAPLPLLLLRLSLAALVLLPWCVPVARHLDRRSLLRILAAGALGMIGYNLSVTVGLRSLPASTAGLLLATEPLWVLALGRAFLAERVRAGAWLGSLVACCGVIVLAGPAALSHDFGRPDLAGIGLVLLGTLAFGAYTIVLRPLSQVYGALQATAATSVAGAIPYLAFAGTLSGARLAQLPAAAWGELLFLALGSTVAGMLLWNRAVLAIGSAKISVLLYLQPLVSVVSAVVFLGERISAATVAGGSLIMAGLAIAGRAQHGQD